MKRIIVFLTAAMMSTGLYAQQENTTIHKHNDHALAEAGVSDGYGCPVCLWKSFQPGKCIHHNVDLIPEGWYYCKTDVDVMSAKAAKCHRCGNEMVRMETNTITPAPPGIGSKNTSGKQVAAASVRLKTKKQVNSKDKPYYVRRK